MRTAGTSGVVGFANLLTCGNSITRVYGYGLQMQIHTFSPVIVINPDEVSIWR